ncbi:MAG: Gfo/Idh/MocA family oxidoreductase [Planctomycetes bacterium]|nr:Gfo/Idh/MocA family oxidoreductase [Planctomycetota bacterium]
MNELRIGIVGLGNMGSVHARQILDGKIPRLKLTAVCDTDPAKFERAPGVKAFTSSAEMIRSGLIDAVFVCTPHYDHTTIGIDGLQQGLHVLIEKPVSVHVADCQRLFAAYEKRPKASQLFGAMFNQRTDPRYAKVRQLIQSGELGEIRRVNWIITDWFRTQSYYNSGGWRATWKGEGGGVLLNQCPHNLDLITWLCGRPSKVRAFCGIGKWHDIEVEDAVTAYMEYPNGATGVFITTTGEAPGTNRLEITAEKGKVVIEGSKVTWTRNVVAMGEFCRTDPGGFTRPEVWNIDIPTDGFGEQHNGILKNFTAAALDGTPLLAPALEGVNSVELANAFLYSSFTDKTVSLPLDGAAYEAHLKKLIAESRFEKKVDVGAKSTGFANSFGQR